MVSNIKNPATWDEYEGRPSPSGSAASSGLHSELHGLLDDDNHDEHRRGSFSNRLAAVADIGGVNSFRSFARSWQRAAGFPEVIPRRPSFIYAGDGTAIEDADSDNIQYGRSHIEDREARPTTSLLRQHLEASYQEHSAGDASSSNALREGGENLLSPSAALEHSREDFRSREGKPLDTEMASGALLGSSPSGRSSIFGNPPYLSTSSIIGSYDSYRSSMYGTIGRESLQPRRLSLDPAAGWVEEEDDEDAAHGEHEPILVKEVKQGSHVVLAVEGQSTLPQSVFNSINAIIGVGILSLPLAFKLSGWIFGLALMTLCACVTGYTGKLLAKCMDYDPGLITYSDLAFVSFGTRARMVVSAMFSLELVAACVALMILFADSLDLLLPGLATVNSWKCLCAVLILVLNALPLRFLSYTSIVGIFSTFGIVCIVIVDGLVKTETPGSLRDPAATYLLPSNWLALPLAYGLMASPWGAHSIFPSIYRDMRHPAKWGKAVKVTFSFSYALDMCLGVIGILMFGDGISDAITSNILKSEGYPKALAITMCIFVAIIPLTKIPLNARPLVTTADVLCGVHEHHHHHHHEHQDSTGNHRGELVKSGIRGVIRVSVVIILLFISIVFPAFDSVCAFLGAALCTVISIILPISFYLKLYWQETSPSERLVLFSLLILFSIFGSVGTVWTFLPKDLIGA
ncbi:hypothetical protein V2G26_020648 [Clonostachys chloroleuca]